MPQTHAFPVSLEKSCQLYGTWRNTNSFSHRGIYNDLCVDNYSKKISCHTKENTFQWTVCRKTSAEWRLTALHKRKSWMLSLPTKSEDDFSVIDGIISLIYIHRCLWLPESDLLNHLHFRHSKEHIRGTKWRKANQRAGPPATHKHSCRKWEALPAAISYHTDRK